MIPAEVIQNELSAVSHYTEMFNVWSIMYKAAIISGGTSESLRGAQGSANAHLSTRKATPVLEVGVRNKGSARITMVPSNAVALLTDGENPAYVTNSGAMLKRGSVELLKGYNPNSWAIGTIQHTGNWSDVHPPWCKELRYGKRTQGYGPRLQTDEGIRDPFTGQTQHDLPYACTFVPKQL